MYTLNASGGSAASDPFCRAFPTVADLIFGQLAAGQAGQQLSVLAMASLNLDFNGTGIK